MSSTDSMPLSGRRAEARRNNERILTAAREVLIEQGYDASMASIAERAGVGIGALYRRYPSKDELIVQMSIAGMDWITERATSALESDADPWTAFRDFIADCVDAGAGELMQLAGRFAATLAQRGSAERLQAALDTLVERTQRDGGLPADFTAADVYLLFAHLRIRSAIGRQRSSELQHRYLALVLRGLRVAGGDSLPGPPPSWSEIGRSWRLPG